MKFGILSQWYDPEPGPAALPGTLARGLRDRGHQVQVVTGFPNYPTGKLHPGYPIVPRSDQSVDGVQVRRTALYPGHGSGTFTRIANYGSFGLTSALLGASALRDCDAVWVNYSPITIAAPMMVARHLWKTPFVTHLLDLWPDTLYASGFARQDNLPSIVDSVLQRWCRWMYDASVSVAYISPGVGSVLESRGVAHDKLHFIPMWANEELFHPSTVTLREALGIGDETVVIVYAGSMGHAQGLETLVDALRETQDQDLICLLAGSGTAEQQLRHQAEDLANVRFVGRIPQDQMTSLSATADILYVGLRDHAASGFTMPSKTQAGLASGKPLLVAATGDVADVADQTGSCLTCPPETAAVARQLRAATRLGRQGLSKLGERSRAYYESRFSESTGIDSIEALLISAAEKGHRRVSGAARQSLSFGPLEATDIPSLIDIHQKAFPSFFLSSLGRPFLGEFYAAFLSEPTAVSVVARRGTKPVGAVVGTTQPKSFFGRLLKRRLLGFASASARAAMRDPRKIPRLISAITYRGEAGSASPEWALLSSICVSPNEQGTGVGAQLVSRWTEEVRRRDKGAAYLTTDRDHNDAVNRFYSSLGWSLEESFVTAHGRRMNTYVTSFDRNGDYAR